MTALDKQVGGTHYKLLRIQPVEYIHANKLGYMEGNVIKYITRYKTKGQLADLEKAKHYIELLIDMETKNEQTVYTHSPSIAASVDWRVFDEQST